MMRNGGFNNYGMSGYSGGGDWGWIMMIGILVLIIIGVIALFKYLEHSHSPVNQLQVTKAIDVLNERYARGEISETEYFKIKNNL